MARGARTRRITQTVVLVVGILAVLTVPVLADGRTRSRQGLTRNALTEIAIHGYGGDDMGPGYVEYYIAEPGFYQIRIEGFDPELVHEGYLESGYYTAPFDWPGCDILIRISMDNWTTGTMTRDEMTDHGQGLYDDWVTERASLSLQLNESTGEWVRCYQTEGYGFDHSLWTAYMNDMGPFGEN